MPEALPEALQAARSIADEFYRAKALTALADKLPEALQAARFIADEFYRAKALTALADKLPSALMPEALQAAC
ncbi:hypothetical protein [Scytonema sp. NUACC26]|uniref:hypothetical protein n=1 Tax=Scytonema sp. NUACC26 TaxID=3140176 RepID=UPI0034DC31B6